jgi:zinc transport system ATP-binding protein
MQETGDLGSPQKAGFGQVQEGFTDLLVVSNLSVRPKERTMLEDVSFKVRKGTTLAIIGPNGGGKTTLFRAILNLVPYTGTIKWSDKVRIGYVPQSLIATDLPISVEEFLRFKCKKDFETCMSSAGLGKEVLNQTLGSLSGGQLQRALIAWAIVDNPDVLLFDEPTSGVDIGAEEPIYQNVTRLKERLGITTLLISHNMHVVMHYSDRVLALNRHQLFYGDTSGMTHSRLLNLMYGGRLDLSEEDEHAHEEE